MPDEGSCGAHGLGVASMPLGPDVERILPDENCSSWMTVGQRLCTSALLDPAWFGGATAERLVWLQWRVEHFPELVEELRWHRGRRGGGDTRSAFSPAASSTKALTDWWLSSAAKRMRRSRSGSARSPIEMCGQP
jgi:hypothetical protein